MAHIPKTNICGILFLLGGCRVWHIYTANGVLEIIANNNFILTPQVDKTFDAEDAHDIRQTRAAGIWAALYATRATYTAH